MTLRSKVRLAAPFALGLACASVSAQQLIGYISTRDAAVTGAKDVLDDRAVLSGSVSVAAKDHTAPITLARGGTVNVCQTSVVHVISRGMPLKIVLPSCSTSLVLPCISFGARTTLPPNAAPID